MPFVGVRIGDDGDVANLSLCLSSLMLWRKRMIPTKSPAGNKRVWVCCARSSWPSTLLTHRHKATSQSHWTKWRPVLVRATDGVDIDTWQHQGCLILPTVMQMRENIPLSSLLSSWIVRGWTATHLRYHQRARVSHDGGPDSQEQLHLVRPPATGGHPGGAAAEGTAAGLPPADGAGHHGGQRGWGVARGGQSGGRRQQWWWLTRYSLSIISCAFEPLYFLQH